MTFYEQSPLAIAHPHHWDQGPSRWDGGLQSSPYRGKGRRSQNAFEEGPYGSDWGGAWPYDCSSWDGYMAGKGASSSLWGGVPSSGPWPAAAVTAAAAEAAYASSCGTTSLSQSTTVWQAYQRSLLGDSSSDSVASAADTALQRTFIQSSGSLYELPEEPSDILVVNSTSSGAYTSLSAEAKNADLVAFDCEWLPDWHVGSDHPISVLQLAFPMSQRVYVLQLGPLEGKLPSAVQVMLVNPEVTKVGFAVHQNDAAKFARSGIAVTKDSVVDIQERCSVALGHVTGKGPGLKWAAEGLLGFYGLQKKKEISCSDWDTAVLSPEQIRYAALDAWVALRLYGLVGA